MASTIAFILSLTFATIAVLQQGGADFFTSENITETAFWLVPQHWSIPAFTLTAVISLVAAFSRQAPSDTTAQEELTKKCAELETTLHDTQQQLAVAAHRPVRESRIDGEIINLLALLQEKGRFIDFVMDDITAYQDAQVGAAARVVHEGCARVLQDYFAVESVEAQPEGQHVTLEDDYKASEYRVIGNAAQQTPFKGRVVHRGWATKTIKLPRVVEKDDPPERWVIQPAEVEVE